MRLHAVAITAVAILVSGGALAQRSATDLERCESLNALYERYLGKKGEGQPGPSLEAKEAIDQCRRGNTAYGIRALEKALRANGFKI